MDGSINDRMHRLPQLTHVILQVMNTLLDGIKQLPNVPRVTVHMPVTVSRSPFNLIEQRLQMMEHRIQFAQIALQVRKAAVVMSHIVHVIGQTRKLAAIIDQMPILGRVPVMTRLLQQTF